MLDIPSISAIVAAAGVLVGVALTVLQLRDLVKTRQTDLIMRLYSNYGSREFQVAHDRFMTRKYENFDDYRKHYGLAEANEIGVFFEGIGILLKRKLVDIQLVDDLFTTPIKVAWEKMEPMIEDARKYYNSPAALEWFEYLYNEMKKREQLYQRGVKSG